MLIFLILFLPLLFFLFYPYLKEKKDKFNSLYSLVSTRYKSRKERYYHCFVIIMKSIYRNIRSPVSIIPLGKNSYKLNYYLGDREYCIIIHDKKGPRLVEEIFDENNISRKDDLDPYLGPFEDFHSYPFTPVFFGRKSLCFILRDGRILNFKERDIIRF